MTRSKVAAKYISLVDSVVAEPRNQGPITPAVRLVATHESVPQHRVHQLVRSWFDGFMDEFDDRALGDYVGSGLQGQ